MIILLVLILLAGCKVAAESNKKSLKHFIETNFAEGLINLALAPAEFLVSPLLGAYSTMLFVTWQVIAAIGNGHAFLGGADWPAPFSSMVSSSAELVRLCAPIYLTDHSNVGPPLQHVRALART